MSFRPLRQTDYEEDSRAPYRVLSVEDDPTDFYILTVILEKYFKDKFVVEHISSLTNLYEKIKEFKPHILLLDFYLHGESSFETIDYLRTNFPDMFIAILSGQDDIRIVLKCVEKGISYVMKGENMETDLLKTLNSAIQYLRLLSSFQKSISVAFDSRKIPFAVFGMASIGPEILFVDRDEFGGFQGENLIDALREMGMYTMFSSGQGENYNEGLSIYQSGSFRDYALYVHSFRKKDESAIDPRLKVGYFQLIAFFPKEYLYLIPPYEETQTIISKVIAMYPQEISEINWESLKTEILIELKKIATERMTRGSDYYYKVK